MPLPSGQMAWPPAQLDTIAPVMAQWSAWYSGDPRALERAYRREHRGNRPSDRPSTFRGGVVGAIARTFWGSPTMNLADPKPKLHVPLAADICQASADLLFSEPPTIVAEDETTNTRLAELVGDGMLSTLAEAAELGAALGGTYLRVTWDLKAQPDGPFLTTVDADGAWPEFRWGRLVAVTFWTVVNETDTAVWRHLERHELDNEGVGIVLHGLYMGTRDNLGRVVPLTDDASTQVLATEVVEGNQISTESPGLAVTYVPNQRPQRRWRHDPLGRQLGRSDLDGVEGLMDALDETYTSWMRDVRLGKARVFVADSLLDTGRPGHGAAFDSDREIFSPLNVLMSPGQAGSTLPIEAQQFAIRFAEHSATADALIESILRTAGYSTQTFGMDDDSVGATTATEIQARQTRSYMTRDRKVRAFRVGLGQVIEKLLAVDNALFSGKSTVATPTITFGDGVQESQLALAQTATALAAAHAASTKTLVTMLHPDWDKTQIDAEVALIASEQTAALPDPASFTGFDAAAEGS